MTSPTAALDRPGQGRVYPCPDKDTGEIVEHPNHTGIIDVLCPKHISEWRLKMVTLGIAHREDLWVKVCAARLLPEGPARNGELRILTEEAIAAGQLIEKGHLANDRGTGYHSLTERLDELVPPGAVKHVDELGLPKPMAEIAREYVACMAGAQIVLSEITAVSHRWSHAGTIDRIIRFLPLDAWTAAFDQYDLGRGCFVFDNKFGVVHNEVAMQLAAAANADDIWDAEAGTYTPLPEDLRKDIGFVFNPDKGLIPVDLDGAYEAFLGALAVKRYQDRNIKPLHPRLGKVNGKVASASGGAGAVDVRGGDVGPLPAASVGATAAPTPSTTTNPRCDLCVMSNVVMCPGDEAHCRQGEHCTSTNPRHNASLGADDHVNKCCGCEALLTTSSPAGGAPTREDGVSSVTGRETDSGYPVDAPVANGGAIPPAGPTAAESRAQRSAIFRAQREEGKRHCAAGEHCWMWVCPQMDSHPNVCCYCRAPRQAGPTHVGDVIPQAIAAIPDNATTKPTKRAWLRGRYDNLVALGQPGVAALQAHWPADLPTMRKADEAKRLYSATELAAAEAAIDAAETDMGVQWPTPDPTDPANVHVPNDDPRVNVLRKRGEALPADLALKANADAQQAGVPSLRTGWLTEARLATLDRLLTAAETEWKARLERIMRALDAAMTKSADANAVLAVLGASCLEDIGPDLTALDAVADALLAGHLVVTDGAVVVDEASVLAAFGGSKKNVLDAAKAAADAAGLPKPGSSDDVFASPLLVALTTAT